MPRTRSVRSALFVLFLTSGAAPVAAGSLTLAWDAPPESSITGYGLWYGTTSQGYTAWADVGNQTTWQVNGLAEGIRYFFSVRAYTLEGFWSDWSGEVSGIVPCAYTVSETSLSIGSAGGPLSVSVTAPSTCNWTIVESVPWLTVTAAAGSGSGSFTLTASPKRARGARNAVVQVAATPPTMLSVTQAEGIGSPLDVRVWDVDQDLKTDVTVWRPGTGTWYVRPSAMPGSPLVRNWGGGWMNDRPVPGDYDGDGRGDYAVWRPAGGMWYITPSGSGYSTSMALQWGGDGDIPVPSDYDGDGRTDLAVWRPANGWWYIRTSSSEYVSSISMRWGLGSAGDVPSVGDFDGDGRADVAVWRRPTGMWYVLLSSLNYSGLYPFEVSWGGPLDTPMVGDYDGDGVSDIAVWRGSIGFWYLLPSSGGFSPASTLAVQWGGASAGDQPVVGDFDGDGRSDIAVWRGPQGLWYIKRSSTNFLDYLTVQWGSSTVSDIPLPR